MFTTSQRASTPGNRASVTKEVAVPEDFLGLFRSESDGIILQPGQELFRKGDVGYHMYAVKSGELQVIDGNHVFETVSSGGIVGEMALISNDTRTATVRAISKSVVVPVDEKRFLFLVQQTPFFAIRILRVMCDRLKVMNERVTLLSE
jgi:CRP/FNR family transcriptional regulator, cyclic AMP receptor protein